MECPNETAAAEIARLEGDRAQAILAGDRDTLAAMTRDDYVHVDTGGRLRSKRDFLAGVNGDDGCFVDYRVLENDIRVLDTVAVVSGIFENSQRASDGTVTRKRGRHVRVYAFEAGSWTNLMHQATGLPD